MQEDEVEMNNNKRKSNKSIDKEKPKEVEKPAQQTKPETNQESCNINNASSKTLQQVIDKSRRTNENKNKENENKRNHLCDFKTSNDQNETAKEKKITKAKEVVSD